MNYERVAMPNAGDPFLAQNRSLETQNGSYFSLFANWHGFKNCKSLFVHISLPFLTS